MAASPSSAKEWLHAQMSFSPGVEEKKGSMSGCDGPRQLSVGHHCDLTHASSGALTVGEDECVDHVAALNVSRSTESIYVLDVPMGS
jgi:hypothetical protein